MWNTDELQQAHVLTDSPHDPAHAGVLASWRERWGVPAAPDPYCPAHAAMARQELRRWLDDADLMRSLNVAGHPCHQANLERFRQLLGAIAP